MLNTFEEWLPRMWCDDLHRNLHLGDAGRWYSEVAASWLWVLALSGLIIWITRKVRTRCALPSASAQGTTATALH